MVSRDEFLKKLRETFRVEASEGLNHITANLISLEKGPSESRRTELIEATFREAHSLKGASRAVNIAEIETVCQALESVFSSLKTKARSLDPDLFDLFHRAVNLLNDLLAVADSEYSDEIRLRVYELVDDLGREENVQPAAGQGSVKEPVVARAPAPVSVPVVLTEPEPAPMVEPEVKPGAPKTDSTVRISLEKLDSLLFQGEEMLSTKQTFNFFNKGLVTSSGKLKVWTREYAEVLPTMQDLNGEIACKRTLQFMEWTASLLKTLEDDLVKLRKLTVLESFNTGIKVDALLGEIKKIMSVPFSTILDVFSKAARDLARDQGKKVAVEITGDGIEIDRRILEEIRSPLMHLLRNSIDHGIEMPEIRIKHNKLATGTIRVAVERLESNRVEITISDDGAGINLAKLRRILVNRGELSESEAADIQEPQLLGYLFKSGISTREMITDLSGRGLGLAIVQEKIEQLGGTVRLNNRPDQGTDFVIEIPLSLITFRGVHVRVGEQEFIVPTSKIEKVIRMEKTGVKTIENKATIHLGDRIIPLVYLSDILKIGFKATDHTHLLLLILGTGQNSAGFIVDEILDEEMVLLKKFNKHLRRLRHIAGATVLGSGKVIPVLNVSDLTRVALKEGAQSVNEKMHTEVEEKRSILVVEDSITSRMLLKNILESAGYRVTTAIDGVEGYTRLREEPADLVVSDVDMPRMNGLDLTAKIRSDKSLSNIPVVLVTSLSKREDRERGMEVGASAYIVKSNFDQSNLLDVIERLIK